MKIQRIYWEDEISPLSPGSDKLGVFPHTYGGPYVPFDKLRPFVLVASLERDFSWSHALVRT